MWIGVVAAVTIIGAVLWRLLSRRWASARMFDLGVISESWLAGERNRKGEQ